MMNSKGIKKWSQFQFVCLPLLWISHSSHSCHYVCVLCFSFCFVGLYLTLQLCVWFPILLIFFLSIDMLLSSHENVLFEINGAFTVLQYIMQCSFQSKASNVRYETDNLSLFIVFLCVYARFPILPLPPDRIISPVYFALMFYLFDFSILIVRMPFWVAILFSQQATCNFLTHVTRQGPLFFPLYIISGWLSFWRNENRVTGTIFYHACFAISCCDSWKHFATSFFKLIDSLFQWLFQTHWFQWW